MNIITRNGKLWIDFYHQSKRVRKSLGLDDNKANRKLAETKIVPELIYKLSHGAAFFENAEQKEKIKYPTVDEVAKISFEGHRGERRELTTQRYIRVYEMHVKPYFGKTQIDTLKASNIKLWQNKLLKKLSSKTVNLARGVFYTIIDDTYRDEIINHNPLARVKSCRESESREKKPFDISEIKKILDYMPESMVAFFAIGFYTGARTGEIIGLKWSDIDLERRTLKIEVAYVKVELHRQRLSQVSERLRSLMPSIPIL